MPIKNNKNVRKFALLAVLSVLLFACSDGEHMPDLRHYIANLKKKVTKHPRNDILADIHFPVPVGFQGQNQRDPFEDEGFVTGGGESLDPLLSSPVKSFEYLGSMTRGPQIWAIVRAPDNKIYPVTINNRFGNHYGKIIAIHPDHLEVEEPVLSPERGQTPVKQVVILQLKGKSE